jgi:hypothetical protein
VEPASHQYPPPRTRCRRRLVVPLSGNYGTRRSRAPRCSTPHRSQGPVSGPAMARRCLRVPARIVSSTVGSKRDDVVPTGTYRRRRGHVGLVAVLAGTPWSETATSGSLRSWQERGARVRARPRARPDPARDARHRSGDSPPTRDGGAARGRANPQGRAGSDEHAGFIDRTRTGRADREGRDGGHGCLAPGDGSIGVDLHEPVPVVPRRPSEVPHARPTRRHQH